MLSKKVRSLALWLVWPALSACGAYSFSGTNNPHIKTVAIPIFQDQTAEFGLKEKLTDKIIDEFTRDNTLRIADRRRADSFLEGIILRVEDRAGAFTSDERVEDIKVFVTVKVRFEDLKKRKVIWEDQITQWGIYDPDEGQESRQRGLDEAIQKIATDILNRTVSGW